MITATSFLRDGDTALWVPPPHLPMNDWTANRPCDTCGGKRSHSFLPPSGGGGGGFYCTDCDGTGRHTFDIEVEREWGALEPRPPLATPVRHLRVHVIEALPIVERKECRDVPAHVCIASDGEALRHAELVNDGSETEWPITLPPAAQPGMWLVRLVVHP